MIRYDSSPKQFTQILGNLEILVTSTKTSPEQNLWIAVIKRAVLDALSIDRELKTDALEFLQNKDNHLCKILEFFTSKPELLQKLILKKLREKNR